MPSPAIDFAAHIEITTAAQVPAAALRAFYESAYPQRPALPQRWSWLYRAAHEPARLPLVMRHEQRVVAHAGGIPFVLLHEGLRHSAQWFIDFAVAPDYQRHGLGVRLTRRWMELADVYVTFCNEKSMGVFRKYGWSESFGTYLHRVFLRPFDHPQLARRLPHALRRGLNAAYGPVAAWRYRTRHIQVEAVREGAWPLDPAAEPAAAPGITTGLRDAAYWAWRIGASPTRADYRVLIHPEGRLLLRLYERETPPSADVLALEPAHAAPAAQSRLLGAAAGWALRQGYSYIRFYTSDAERSARLQRTLGTVVTHPRFAYYARTPGLHQALARARWRWDLLDSDFERTSHASA